MSMKSRILKKENDFFKAYEEELLEYEKSSQLFAYNLIEYTIDNSNESSNEFVAKGYEFMGKINLQLSEQYCEQESTDINEYEKWLCGV